MSNKEKKSEKKRYQAWSKKRNTPGLPSLNCVHASSKKEAAKVFAENGYLVDGEVQEA